MNANLAALLYLVSGILFILALRGLSSPATSRQGNRFGMIGMGDRRSDDAGGSSAVECVLLASHHSRRSPSAAASAHGALAPCR